MNPLPQSILEKLYSLCTDDDCVFGLWINALFSLVESPAPHLSRDLSFPEQKEAFLWVLERLLREGRVLLAPPDVLEGQEPFFWVIMDGYSGRDSLRPATRADGPATHIGAVPCRFPVWDVPIERQIAYIREAFPKSATGQDDDELHLFWYDGRCPDIGWIDPETGVLWAS